MDGIRLQLRLLEHEICQWILKLWMSSGLIEHLNFNGEIFQGSSTFSVPELLGLTSRLCFLCDVCNV